MNIRTPLVNIVPRRSSNRRAFACMVVLLGALLGGCATGNSETANEAATREAGQVTNVVADIEKTQIVKAYFSDPAGTPSPYPTQIPTLANLRLTTTLGDQDAPGQTIYTYTGSDGPLYCDAQIAHLHPGESVLAVWQSGGNTVYTSQVNIENDRELVWIALLWDGSSSASPGNYIVHVQVVGPGTNDDGTPTDVTTELGSLEFRIT